MFSVFTSNMEFIDRDAFKVLEISSSISLSSEYEAEIMSLIIRNMCICVQFILANWIFFVETYSYLAFILSGELKLDFGAILELLCLPMESHSGMNNPLLSSVLEDFMKRSKYAYLQKKF